LERKGEKERERERERESEREREILSSFSKRFSPDVEIQYIFYRVTFSPNKRESLEFQVSLSFSLFYSPSPVFLYLRGLLAVLLRKNS
jgi:hypothetical protein